MKILWKNMKQSILMVWFTPAERETSAQTYTHTEPLKHGLLTRITLKLFDLLIVLYDFGLLGN